MASPVIAASPTPRRARRPLSLRALRQPPGSSASAIGVSGIAGAVHVALGADSGISKSEVCRICEQLDESVGAFRTRALDHIAFPYVYLDATYLHVRNKPGKGGQVVSMAVVVATGIAETL